MLEVYRYIGAVHTFAVSTSYIILYIILLLLQCVTSVHADKTYRIRLDIFSGNRRIDIDAEPCKEILESNRSRSYVDGKKTRVVGLVKNIIRRALVHFA